MLATPTASNSELSFELSYVHHLAIMEPVGVAFAALGTADLCLRSVTSSLFPERCGTSYESAFRSHFSNRLYRIMIGITN